MQHKFSQQAADEEYQQEIKQMKSSHGLIWSEALQGCWHGENGRCSEDEDSEEHQPPAEVAQHTHLFVFSDFSEPPQQRERSKDANPCRPGPAQQIVEPACSCRFFPGRSRRLKERSRGRKEDRVALRR